MKNTNKNGGYTIVLSLEPRWKKKNSKKPGSIMRKGRRMVLQDSFGGSGSGFGHARGAK